MRSLQTPIIFFLNISIQFSHSVVSDSLWPHGLQHARLPCPSPTPRACSNSCLSSQWCHPTISSSTVPFSSCLQSFPASGSFLMSQFFASGGQRIGASVSESVLPVNIQGWFSLALTAFRDFSNYWQRDLRWREQSLTRWRPWKPSDSALITSSLPNAPQTPIFCWKHFLKL